MSDAMRTLRAFRPSAYRDEDPLEDRLVQIVRARNVARYAKMVRQGVRLFEHERPGGDVPAASRPDQASASQG